MDGGLDVGMTAHRTIHQRVDHVEFVWVGADEVRGNDADASADAVRILRQVSHAQGTGLGISAEPSAGSDFDHRVVEDFHEVAVRPVVSSLDQGKVNLPGCGRCNSRSGNPGPSYGLH